MHRIWILFKKEFTAYFISPIAYIVITVFLVAAGWFFFSTYFLRGQVSLRYFFELLPYIFSFVIPAVTMKLFSEEFNTGSYELLMTLPVTFRQVLLAKLAAAAAFVAVMLAPTMFYAVSVSFTGELDWGPVAGGYLGALLLGTVFSALGIFTSSFTRNQIIAFIVAAALCFGLTILDVMLFFLPAPALEFFQYLAVGPHFDNISKGVIDSRDVLYFFSLAFVAVYGAYLVLCEKQ